MPLLLIVYLGGFSRLIWDDFKHLAIGRDLGPWESMLYWRAHHNGSFSHYLLHGLVAPLDTSVPPLAPAAIALIWLVGLTWLLKQTLDKLGCRAHALPVALALGGLALSAANYSLHNYEALFWYSASTRYSLPFALFTLCLALCGAFAEDRNPRARFLAMAASAALCFFAAGLAETSLVVLLLALLLALPLLPIVRGWKRARAQTLFLLPGLGAVIAAAAIVVTAPGVAKRLSMQESAPWTTPVRNLSALVPRALDSAFEFAGHQPAFLAFMCMFGAGMFAALWLARSHPSPSRGPRGRLASGGLWLVLLLQLALAPVLLTHHSDSQQVLGRYSYAYAIILLLNASQIILAAALLAWRRALADKLLSRIDRLVPAVAAVLLAVAALYVFSQLRSIHYLPATYLLLSALALIAALGAQLAVSVGAAGRDERYGWLALMSSLLALMSLLPSVVMGHVVFGQVIWRALAHFSFLQAISGLAWGAFIGYLICRLAVYPRFRTVWLRGFRALALALVIGSLLIMLSNLARLIEPFRTFAREWDDRHALLLRADAAGESEVAVRPFTFDMARHISQHHVENEGDGFINVYYGLDLVRIETAEHGA